LRTRIHLDNDKRDDWSLETDNSQKSDRRYGLEDIRGFDSLPDKEPKSVKSTFLTTGVLLDITSLQVSLSPLGYGFNGEE